ncbi:toll/interleukin-1 receptor domain-containing protein [Archangium violaceum]|uniref:toll/interleukin-1 receptor domain-containing protein n=1 Tax=Archangium violaceum TaxID=83451 RepID=UPI002B2BC406|nr:toll/interleukin-1 receptor domain-containing protein [Archangium violaceum]
MPPASSEPALLNASEIARLLAIVREGEYDLRIRALRLIVRLPIAQDAWRELSLLLMDRVSRLALAEHSYLLPSIEFQEALKVLAISPLPETKQFLRELKEQGSDPQREVVRNAEEVTHHEESTRLASPSEQPRPEVNEEHRARADALAEPWLNPDFVPPFPDADTFGLLRAVSPPVARRLASSLFVALSPGGTSRGGWESNALVAWISGLQSEFSPDVAQLFEAYCSQQNPDIRQQLVWAISRAPLRDILLRPGGQEGGVLIPFLEQVLSLTAKASPPLASLPTLNPPGVFRLFHSQRMGGTDAGDAAVRVVIPEADAARPMLVGLAGPSRVARGSKFTVRFVALVEGLKAELRKLLAGSSPRARPPLKPQAGAWQPGTTVQLHLSGPYLKVSPARPWKDAFIWNGSYEILDFEVEVDKTAPMEAITDLQCDVSVMGVRVAVVRMGILLSGEAAPSPRPWALFSAPFSKSFASYAPENKNDVSLIASRLKDQTGMELFMDCVDLHAGSRWRDQRLAAIRACPQFVLFWSSHARQSPWVTWEWRTALEVKRDVILGAQLLEPVHFAPLPDELVHLRFDDSLLHRDDFLLKLRH